MMSKIKAEAIGRVLIIAQQLDTLRSKNHALQKILGEKLYYKKIISGIMI